MHGELHIALIPTGHVHSVDCWCEPHWITMTTDKLGRRILVVEHEDETRTHHDVVLNIRTATAAEANAPIDGPNCPWVSRRLNEIDTAPPYREPHERNL